MTSLEREKAKLENSIEELSHSLEYIITSSDKSLEELQTIEANYNFIHILISLN